MINIVSSRSGYNELLRLLKLWSKFCLKFKVDLTTLTPKSPPEMEAFINVTVPAEERPDVDAQQF
jgi:hypothetical protein